MKWKVNNMINRIVLAGRMTKDPEFKVTPSGVSVATFTLAVNRAFKKDEADFINVVCFKKIAENTNTYCSKGSLVGVDGRIQTRNYENNEGKKVYVTEVIADSVQFLETKGKNAQSGQSNTNTQQQQNNAPTPPQNANSNNPFANATGPIDISDDMLPF